MKVSILLSLLATSGLTSAVEPHIPNSVLGSKHGSGKLYTIEWKSGDYSESGVVEFSYNFDDNCFWSYIYSSDFYVAAEASYCNGSYT